MSTHADTYLEKLYAQRRAIVEAARKNIEAFAAKGDADGVLKTYREMTAKLNKSPNPPDEALASTRSALKASSAAQSAPSLLPKGISAGRLTAYAAGIGLLAASGAALWKHHSDKKWAAQKGQRRAAVGMQDFQRG